METAESNGEPPVAFAAVRPWEATARWGAILFAVLAGFGPPLIPVTGGLDSGWQLGISWASELGLRWGRGIIFTYGPWGHVTAMVPLSSELVWQALGVQLLSLALVAWATWQLSERGGRWRAALVAIPVTAAASSAGLATALFLGVMLCCVAVALESGVGDRFAWILGGLAGFSVLIKFNTGLASVAIGALAMIATARWGRSLIGFLTFAIAGLVGGWLAASQSLRDLVPWLSASVDIAVGYRSAMRHVRADLAGWLPFAIIVFGLAMTVLLGGFAWLSGSELATRRRIALTSAVCAAAIALYLGSATRLDAGHLGILPCGFFALGVPLASSLGCPGGAILGHWRRESIALPAVAVLSLVCVAASVGVLGVVGAAQYLHPASSVETFLKESRLAVSASARAATLVAQQGQIRNAYSVPAWELATADPPVRDLAGPSAAVVDALRGTPTHVEPWAIALAWAHGLPWRPTPVIQTFAAYTTRLDELNALSLRSAEGPTGILRQSAAIDGKCPLWESPRYQVAMLCNFRQVVADGRWQALERVRDRCMPRRVLVRASLHAREQISVPRVDGALVVAELSSRADRSGSSRSPVLVDCGTRTYRLAQGIPSGPLVMRADASGWDAATMPAPCETLRVDRPVDVVFSAVAIEVP